MPLVCERMVSVCSPSARALGAWKLPEQSTRWARSRPHLYVVLAATCQANVPVLSLVGFAGFSVSCGAGVRVGFASAVPARGPATTATGTARAMARAIQRLVTPNMAKLLKAGESDICVVRIGTRANSRSAAVCHARSDQLPPSGQALPAVRLYNEAGRKTLRADLSQTELGQAWRRGASVPQSMRPSPVMRIR